MISKSIIGAACACLSVVSMNASAAIISVDWNTAGDNLITQDTSTGLEWLDLTATTTRSHIDISSKFGAGMEFDGWRYATTAEIASFFDAFGGDSSYYYAGYSFQNDGLFESVSQFWGDTYCEAFACSTGQGYSYFTTSEFVMTGIRNKGYISNWYDDNLTDGMDFVKMDYEYALPGDDSFDEGHALVRDTVVPVPAAAWLFGSGLIGLIGLARRKKA